VAKIYPRHKAQSRRWAAQAEAADYLDITPKTLRRMVATGQVTGYRMGPRLIRFDLDELDALMRPIPTTKAG
jgi:excisionase family DNA binding protein